MDLLLAGAISDGNVEQLYNLLLENADGPLKAYLERLSLEEQGIRTPEDLIRHLEEAGEANGFSMDDVRRAMISAVDHSLEVDRVYERLLETNEGAVLDILRKIHLRNDGILTVEDLIAATYKALVEKGYSQKEIRKILTALYPDHAGFIDDLLKKGKQEGKGFPVYLGILLAGFAFFLFFLWFRRRKKEE